jgi:hypothetical protein
MNTFARVLAAVLAITTSALAAPVGLQLPPAGDCRQMAATSGAGFWVGRFTGTYKDFFDDRRPLFAEGCFATEYECRRWVNEVQSIAIDPGLMVCRPGVAR